MAFTYAILGRRPLLPSNKRLAESGKIEEIWGTWNGAAVTTGDIVTGGAKVLFFSDLNAVGARKAKVELDTPAAGSVRMSGFTASDTGRFHAHIQYNS